ncbi:hypothetical protein [Actinokineospora sp. NBRC 105648]|uniref:hypothetical protein n=1 Tax=Actinokineospora sp. NBRC 105648 TaxID=3032206 RepID=UPI0024A3649E|nr:hypothetical protein [Actinokineospora sp. NBRC 105648]GLZ38433.1 hypothetical protein Acsp05_20570 [Actinokineospora sp. NBRC 105648]
MDKRVDGVVEVDLTGGTQWAKAHLFGKGPLEPAHYLASLRVDMGAYRDFLRRLGVLPGQASRVAVRLFREVGEGVVHRHQVHGETLQIYLGAALVRLSEARGADPGLTESAGAALLARDLSDAMIHLGGHLSGREASTEELAKPQRILSRALGTIGAVIGFAIFTPLLGELSLVGLLTYGYAYFAVLMGYGLGASLGHLLQLRAQSESGELRTVHERWPDQVSAEYADEPPFVTVELTPFDTWPRQH